MKKFLILLFVTMAVALSAISAERTKRKVTGSGVITERHIVFDGEYSSLAGYEGISASRMVKVVVTPDINGEILIAADDNIIDYVTVERYGDCLKIGIDNNVNEVVGTDITVQVPLSSDIESLAASASAVIVGKAAFTADDFSISASSAAHIEAAVKSAECRISASSAATVMVATLSCECDIMATSAATVEVDMQGGECDVAASSSATVTLTGEIAEGDFEASSSADIKAGNLKAGTLNVEASSGADIDVWCTKRLEADASSSADITYTGECEWKIDKSSGGDVRRK